MLRRFRTFTATAILAVTPVASLLVPAIAHANPAQTCVWTGTAGDNKFSTTTNWTSCGGGKPLTGDAISFKPTNSLTTPALINDLGVALGGILYGDSTQSNSTSTSYTINTVTLADNAYIQAINAQNSNYSNASVSVGAITIGAHLTLNGHQAGLYSTTNSDINVPVQNLTITGTGLSTITQSSGGSGGSGGASVNFQPANVTVNSGSEYYAGSSVTSATTADNARLFIGSDTQPAINLTLGASAASAPGLVVFNTKNITGNVVLNGDTYYYVYGDETLTASGALSGSGALKPATGSTGTFTNSSSSNSSQTAAGSQTVSVTELPAITDSQPTVDYTVAPKTIVALDGSRRYVDVLTGATLKGNGSMQYLFVESKGTVAPGHSPGRLTVQKTLYLSPGSIYQAELKDKADGNFDQIVVGAATDTNNTNPDVTLGDSTGSPTLDLRLYDGYKISAGDQFMIINNLSKTDVKGTFANLPEGATTQINGIVFGISYKGGDGNDVVLTAKTVPKTPDTGFGMAAAHPLVTLGLTVIAAGTIVGLAQRSRKLASRR